MADLAADIVATMRHPVLVVDDGLSIQIANRAFCDTFEVTPADTEGRRLHEIGNGQWDIPELRRLIGEVLADTFEVRDYRVEHDFERIGRRVMLVNARRIAGPRPMALLAIEDTTERERLAWELEGQKEYAEKIVDASRDALLILDWDLNVRSANETFYTTFRVDPAGTEGRPVYELGNGQWDIPALRELLERVLPDNDAFDDFEVEHTFPEIGHRVMLLNARRIDHMQLVLLAIEDVTVRRRQERELRASEARLRRILETEAVGVLFFDSRSGILTDANEVFLRMTGYAREDVAGRRLSWRSLTPAEWLEASEREMARLRGTGRFGPYEKEYLRRDGTRSWMLFAGQQLDDDTIVEFCIDIEDRKRAEQERELLAHELSHRVKNTLAVVQALATRTDPRAKTAEAFREAFLGRLQAFARAHGLLVDREWQSADLDALVSQVLEPFRAGRADRIRCDGPSVTLNARQALGLSMVLHELGTNAAKYGALSTAEGRLTVAWRIEPADGAGRVLCCWQERDGPPVTRPDTAGFGTRMIQGAVGYELDGDVELDYAPEGLTCRIAFPLDGGT